MPQYTVSVEVQADIERAWDVFMDESKIDQWLIGFKSMETIEGEPLSVGSKHKMFFEDRGREVVLVETVRDIRPPREFVFDLDHELMNSTVRVTLEERSRGVTLISSHTNAEPTKILWKLLMFFMVPNMKKRQRQNFENLKTIIESADR